ncbi:MarR family transcriptional regulator [candidate division KSB1 bacterium]|nr:MAG: MarR family transcriptional regulator [candidate division KSB1 bacterium]
MTSLNTDPLNYNPNDTNSLVKAFPAFLIIAGEIALRGGDQFIFGKFELTVPKYSLLAGLVAQPSLSMTELKNWLFLPRSASNLTQMVDDMESRGLVRRIPSPTDRRVSLVEITDAGRTLLQQVDEFFVQSMRDYSREYNLDELRITMKVLRQFILETGQELGIFPPRISKNAP